MTKTDKSCAHVIHMARHINLETIKKKQFNRAPKMDGREEWGKEFRIRWDTGGWSLQLPAAPRRYKMLVKRTLYRDKTQT